MDSLRDNAGEELLEKSGCAGSFTDTPRRILRIEDYGCTQSEGRYREPVCR